MTMNEQENGSTPEDECIHSHPVPPSELARYSIDRDADSEQDIARYVEIEAPDEKVQHVERVKREVVLGDAYDIWDVTTDKNRWWVITNSTNLYSQRHFPSLDYTISFHVGLMMRLRSRPAGEAEQEPSPFDEVFRRQEQAKKRHDEAVEAEDYQAVGMQLRECLISLIAAIRRRLELPPNTELPQDSNFIGWTTFMIDQCCPGSSHKELRQYLRGVTKDTWQLVNWLTHHRNANTTASSIAIHGCDTVVGHFIQILVRDKTDNVEKCPMCKSRDVRTHFDHTIEPDGEYYITCGVCNWTTHPGTGRAAESDAAEDGSRDSTSD
jgi:hypothetical protein